MRDTHTHRSLRSGPDLAGSGLPGAPSAPFPPFGNLHLGPDSSTKRPGPENPPFLDRGARVWASDSRRTTPLFISPLIVPRYQTRPGPCRTGTPRVQKETTDPIFRQSPGALLSGSGSSSGAPLLQLRRRRRKKSNPPPARPDPGVKPGTKPDPGSRTRAGRGRARWVSGSPRSSLFVRTAAPHPAASNRVTTHNHNIRPALQNKARLNGERGRLFRSLIFRPRGSTSRVWNETLV